MDSETLSFLLEKPDLTDSEITVLLALSSPEDCARLQLAAYEKTTRTLGSLVYYRGLIEISNICTANCRYCGIRRDNRELRRYEMRAEQILEAALWAARNGYGSVCLQAGERRDEKFISFIESVLEAIHAQSVSETLPNGLGITLSLGDQSESTYRRWAAASGNPDALRYLSRFETSNPLLFDRLHSAKGANNKSLPRRLECLRTLRRCGYQVGTGVMIGIPGQRLEDLARDIRLFQELDVDMIGMGPYLKSSGSDMPQAGARDAAAQLQLALNMIAVTRLVMGPVNIAAATALDVLDPRGRELGILHGCNVIMPNISPRALRAGYQLYDNKSRLLDGPPMQEAPLDERIERCGRRVGWNLAGSSVHYLSRTAASL
jgi:biotin synthase